MRNNNRPVIVDKMNISLSQPKRNYPDFKISYGNKSGNKSRTSGSSNSSVFGAFSTITFIVLFMLFTTTIGDLPEPINTTNIQTNTDYIKEISPTVGENSVQAISSFFLLAEGTARVIESLVVNFGTIANGVVSFFQPNWLFGSDNVVQENLGEVCIVYEDLDLARRTFVSATYGLYRFGYLLQNPEYTTVQDYWNFIQFRNYGLVCS
jgi:hypothetical protein